MSQTEVRALIRRLHKAQQRVTNEILDQASFDQLACETPNGFTVNDTLRMWVWHYWSHHRDLIMARGRLTDDNPHFHVPHYVRQANEAFGAFVGELACLSDEQLDLCVPDGGRSVREVVEHTLATLERHFVEQIQNAARAEEGPRTKHEPTSTQDSPSAAHTNVGRPPSP
jgi:hypothetical protein